jgi:hypothetical protein
MAGPHTFIGGVDGDFGTAGNWDTAAVPVDGEAWGVNHLTEASIDTGLDQSAKTFSRVDIGRGFQGKRIAIDTASPLLCNITKLTATGAPLAAFFKGTIAEVVADLDNQADDALVLHECPLSRLNVLAGRVRVTGTVVQPAGAIFYLGTLGGSEDDLGAAVLTIEEDVDLTTNDAKIIQMGGTLYDAVSCDDLVLGGGVFYLGLNADQDTTYAAALAMFHQTGGLLEWAGDGTIAMGHVAGGHFSSARFDLAKVLTNLSMYGNGQVDLRNGHNITVTNPIRSMGRHEPRYPIGGTRAAA